jgi:hypothetical protein
LANSKNLSVSEESIEAFQRLVQNNRFRGALIGGVAVSLLGYGRFTADLDAVFLLSLEDLASFLKAAEAEDFVPRIAKVEEFAQRTRVLLLVHSKTGTEFDVSMGQLPFEKELVERSQTIDYGNVQIPVASVEDIVIMKAIAHRTQDLADLESLIEIHPDLDRERIRKWVKQFADVLENPEILVDLEKILSKP